MGWLWIALMAGSSGLLQGQAGHWEGVIKREGREALFSVDLLDKPEWNGFFSIPGQNAPPLGLGGVEVKGPQIRFEVREFPGDPVFQGILAEGGSSIKGTVIRAGAIDVFEMRRTGHADAPAASLPVAIDARLLGEWEGNLESSQPLTLRLHLSADESGKALGSLSTADLQARNLVVSEIVLEKSNLSFAVRLIGGRFQGELNEDRSKISGTWTQGGSTRPLTLVKQK